MSIQCHWHAGLLNNPQPHQPWELLNIVTSCLQLCLLGHLFPICSYSYEELLGLVQYWLFVSPFLGCPGKGSLRGAFLCWIHSLVLADLLGNARTKEASPAVPLKQVILKSLLLQQRPDKTNGWCAANSAGAASWGCLCDPQTCWDQRAGWNTLGKEVEIILGYAPCGLCCVCPGWGITCTVTSEVLWLASLLLLGLK